MKNLTGIIFFFCYVINDEFFRIIFVGNVISIVGRTNNVYLVVFVRISFISMPIDVDYVIGVINSKSEKESTNSMCKIFFSFDGYIFGYLRQVLYEKY